MKHLIYILFIAVFSVSGQNYHYAITPPENIKPIELIFPASNQIDWSVAGVDGGIPNYNKIIDVTTLGARKDGKGDNHAIIQSALDKAQPGTIFYFPEGEYMFRNTLFLKNKIVIRGECSDKTTLKFDLNRAAKPSLWFLSKNISSITPVISGFEKGSKVITVNEPSKFEVGDYAEIIQDNDPKKMYTNPTWNTVWAENSVGQMVKITAVNGNKISLARQLYHNFSPSLNVRVRNAKMITGAGLENLKIQRIDDGDDYNIKFKYAANCWIRNVEGDFADRGHVDITTSANIEVRDSYFHHAHNYGEGGHGYGINLAGHPTDCLIENNIFQKLRHVFLAKQGAIGNVFAYNYSVPSQEETNDITLHGHYGLMNLLEGNVVEKIFTGDYWGPSGPGNTYFRNRVERDIQIQDHSHFQNIIGNELVKGRIKIANDTKNTWQHNNINTQGFIEQNTNFTIFSSLYLSHKPEFFKSLQWPAIGPEFKVGQNSIPAKARWDTGKALVPCLN